MSTHSLHLVILGRGKTGLLVASVAEERGHRITVVPHSENANAAWLTTSHLAECDVVVDFTTPAAVLSNIAACIAAQKSMVVGTTGWYGGLDQVRQAVEGAGTGFVYGANFSYGVNLFFQIARAAAPALTHGYMGHITERHHIHKKDAPSGTAIALQRVLEEATKVHVGISSEREGDVPGIHSLELASAGDRLVLTHEARSRRTFAEGAILATEWISEKKGFYAFQDIFNSL